MPPLDDAASLHFPDFEGHRVSVAAAYYALSKDSNHAVHLRRHTAVGFSLPDLHALYSHFAGSPLHKESDRVAQSVVDVYVAVTVMLIKLRFETSRSILEFLERINYTLVRHTNLESRNPHPQSAAALSGSIAALDVVYGGCARE